MFDNFKKGIGFGLGFGLSFALVWYLFAYLAPAQLFSQDFPEYESDLNFHDLSLQERINQASVIAIVSYKHSNGINKAIIQEILKKDINAKFSYEEGEEYPEASFYPEEGYLSGEGAVLFFFGNNAVNRRSSTIHRGRIPGEKNMPVEVLRTMVLSANA